MEMDIMAIIQQYALVPVAVDGAHLPGDVKIKRGKLRGEVSEGMLCSLGELGLTAHNFPNAIEDGIFIIDFPCEIGQSIVDAINFDDDVYEFEITPNRPDCLSVLGLARETAATFGLPFKKHVPSFTEVTDESIDKYLSVTVKNTELCPRYTARVVRNIKVEPSPEWMRERLHASGVRPINNIVDITNYVMLEYNQPMHAFDYRNVKDNEIIIRQAREGEHIVTLDDIDRALTPDMMVIADSEKPIAVAGIMGGEYSGTYDDTNTVIFESACFNAVNVRYTEKGLGMKTESSVRFEKGLDPENTLKALTRALELVEELDAGDVVGGFVDIKGNMPERRTLKLDPDRINSFLGTDLPVEEMVSMLRSLEFEVSDDLTVTPPSFRADILLMNDIAEEIARLYGYNNIPSTVMTGVATAQLTERQHFERDLARRLVAAGLYEVKTYSFMGTKTLDLLKSSDYIGMFKDLPAKKNGNPVNYSVREENVSGSYQNPIVEGSSSEQSVIVVRNTLKTPGDGDFHVEVRWEQEPNSSVRPASVNVKVLADGALSVEKWFDADTGSGWEYVFRNLLPEIDGKPVTYGALRATPGAPFRVRIMG